MRDLIREILGWLGYLERSEVLLQVLAFGAALVLMRRLLRHRIAAAGVRRAWRSTDRFRAGAGFRCAGCWAARSSTG